MNKYFDEDDIRIRLLKHISASTSHLTQRDFAGHLGLSLGKTHWLNRTTESLLILIN